nr:PREDICTED: uncharacterized protein LOC106702066 [Latimeria chalumnae]XP_014339675.1 PREDICTED: uncharacterized protein LOC106702066 [Latimeria chalumnae]|eukprot:XP_014339674.1 PREDICTED: uncharacterized protein LOC106702066 [Latimeria chalumnae]
MGNLSSKSKGHKKSSQGVKKLPREMSPSKYLKKKISYNYEDFLFNSEELLQHHDTLPLGRAPPSPSAEDPSLPLIPLTPLPLIEVSTSSSLVVSHLQRLDESPLYVAGDNPITGQMLKLLDMEETILRGLCSRIFGGPNARS